MDLKISYEDLLDIIKQLPSKQLDRLKSDLSKLIKKPGEAKSGSNEFQKLLLSGPTMSKEQYKEFQACRKHFNA
ncbi:MAG: hypothetical protein R2879_22870 [Saprospiraceae bacterium]